MGPKTGRHLIPYASAHIAIRENDGKEREVRGGGAVGMSLENHFHIKDRIGRYRTHTFLNRQAVKVVAYLSCTVA